MSKPNDETSKIIHDNIKYLKHRIATENMTTKDIDIVNEIERYIKELEESRIVAEPALLETFDEMVPGNVVIQNASIYIACDIPPTSGLIRST